MPADPADDQSPASRAAQRSATADRLDALAETADLMDDADGALRFRRQAEDLRLAAMRLLDDAT